MATTLFFSARLTSSRWNQALLCHRILSKKWFIDRNEINLNDPASRSNISSLASSHVSVNKIYNTLRKQASQINVFGQSLVRWYSLEGDEKKLDKKEVSHTELVALINSGGLQLIDVREPKELEELGKIPQAINIPLPQLKATLSLADEGFLEKHKIAKPAKHDLNVVFYGLSAVKSLAALEIAHKLGYKNGTVTRSIKHVTAAVQGDVRSRPTRGR